MYMLLLLRMRVMSWLTHFSVVAELRSTAIHDERVNAKCLHQQHATDATNEPASILDDS